MRITRDRAMAYLDEARRLNDGGWIVHSLAVGTAAERIAALVEGLDAERAFVFGVLHDIGRRFGEMGMNHVILGYHFLLEQGDTEAAEICLTHSFPVQEITAVHGGWDLTSEDYAFLDSFLQERTYTKYDRLIQLCDAMATGEGIVAIERRMMDIMLRYGIDETSLPRWHQLFAMKAEFEQYMGRSVESALGLCTLVAI
ncbi:HD domain-containing protein [Selenomonas timonae]|nr:HD domain-containing protein [Selenomonas timonae]